MIKEKVLEITEKEAFCLGKENKENGFSIHYNPYRNLDTFEKNVANLQNAWFEGYNS